ncbi:MAG TPA: FtsX-like permease family protein [Arsenicitalea sp.]|jgi:putative ABC transport system permease protein|nr:FtsX-like permease family protein [Arsenicitalea sp.]
MIRLLDWMRIGMLDLRGDLRRFGVLIACLALGTGTIAAVGSVGAALQQAVVRDATTLMGGHLEASRPDRDANATELAFLQTLGQVTHVVDTNARGTSGDNSAFIDLLVVGDNYPLLGNVVSPQLKLGEKPSVLLDQRGGAYGAIADPVLLDRLGIGIGGHFKIGGTEFEARGTLTSVPDGAVRGFHLGLTALISTAALAATPDARPPLPGMLTQHRYKIVLKDLTYDAAAAAIATQFHDVNWKTRSPREAAGNLARYYDLFTRFLLIVGLSSLLVGGVGVSNGVTAYIGERQRSIATMRSLGATGPRIMVHFLTQIGVLAAVGVGLGVLLGAVSTALALPLLGKALNVDLPASIDPKALLTAAAFGLLAAFAFSYLPLVRAEKVRPVLLFRSLGSVMPQANWRDMVRPGVLAPIVLAALGIFWLAVVTTDDFRLVLSYAVGVAFAFLLLRAAGLLLQFVLRLVPPLPNAAVRNAFSNIVRPGSSAPVVIMSLGLGLAMLLVIALLNSNLHSQLLGAVSRDAPTFVATDLFDDEVGELQSLAKTDPMLTKFESSPMLRGEVTAVKGTPSSEFKNLPEEAAFMLDGEIPLTWLRDLPAGTTVVDGKWWPSDYTGKPLISLRSTMKSQLGLNVGDTVQFKLFGDTIEATVANFREYQWQNGINFMVTFSPGVIQNYPSSYLGTIKASPGHEKDLERTLARQFSEITFIPIGDALNQAVNILGQLGTAVNIVGGLAVVNGLLVLAGTMSAGRKQREADAVVQKVLGATRANVVWVFTLEYGLLGAFAALIATLVGTAGAWAITQRALEVGFAIDPLLILSVIAGAVLLTIAAGAATTWSALSTRPAQFLRNA